MHNTHARDLQRDTRRAARRQTAAAVLLAVFSLFSPAPDLRPKPLLPVKYQHVKPSDPPDFDPDAAWSTARRRPESATPAPSARRHPQARAHWPAYHPFRSEQARARYLAMYHALAADWPVHGESIHLDGEFGSTHARVSGPPDGPPIVLLHGISSNSLAWQPNIAALAQHHRVYALDHIMDGGLSVYTRPLTCLQDHMDWLDGVLDGLGLEQGVKLVGLSYGAWQAAQYALFHPQRLHKVVLIAPAGTVLPLSFAWVLRAVACALPLPYFTRSFLRWLLPDLARQPTGTRPGFSEVLAQALVTIRCLAPRTMVPPTVLSDAEWQHIKTPMLYLVGEHEKICDPVQAMHRMHTTAPHIASRRIANAGHDLTLVQAAVVNRHVLAFLASPQAGTGQADHLEAQAPFTQPACDV